jgi:hypothetical protein
MTPVPVSDLDFRRARRVASARFESADHGETPLVAATRKANRERKNFLRKNGGLLFLFLVF